MLKEAILLKCGEIALKGQNRSSFEQMLMKNARRVLRGTGDFTLRSAQSTICVEPQGPADMDEASGGWGGCSASPPCADGPGSQRL
jgi:thiamine biosynthesis protein ThiI